MGKISAVINTFNEEKNIEPLLKNIGFVDEIIVCDMHSDDKTVEIAKAMGAKIYIHERMGFVEPARNFAISKASNEWILLLDADERLTDELIKKIKLTTESTSIDYLQIPRKNIIFNKWMQAAMWWPDYHIRLFKKDFVKWDEKIHSKPEARGHEEVLEAEEENAIIHYNYQGLDDYLEKLLRYTKIQSEQQVRSGYKFEWTDLLRKPLSEFLSRFFASKGYEDGLHGLSLSLLQAFSEFILILRVWEKEGFNKKDLELKVIDSEFKRSGKEINFWIDKSLKVGKLKKILTKLNIG